MVNTYMNIYVAICNVFLHTHERTCAHTYAFVCTRLLNVSLFSVFY